MLPISLESATERMVAPDSIAREEGMFGNVFVEHYGGTREHEVKVWNEAVTSWEGTFKLYCGPHIFADTLLQWNDISSWHRHNVHSTYDCERKSYLLCLCFLSLLEPRK